MEFNFEILNIYGSFLILHFTGTFWRSNGTAGTEVTNLWHIPVFWDVWQPYLGWNVTHIRVMPKIRIHYLFWLQMACTYYEYIRFFFWYYKQRIFTLILWFKNWIILNITHIYYFNIQVDFINFITEYLLV